MSEQPPSGDLKWFKPQPDAEGKYWFPERVEYLAATWCEHTREWSYAVGFFEPDTWDDQWELIGTGGVATDLEEIDWLARLDRGKPSPQKTLPGLDGGKSVSQTFPPTISRDDWFPCEPDEDGGINLHEGRQYLAACRYRDRITLESYVTYTVVTPSYDDDGRLNLLSLVTEDGEVPVSEVAFLAFLEGEQ